MKTYAIEISKNSIKGYNLIIANAKDMTIISTDIAPNKREAKRAAMRFLKGQQLFTLTDQECKDMIKAASTVQQIYVEDVIEITEEEIEEKPIVEELLEEMVPEKKETSVKRIVDRENDRLECTRCHSITSFAFFFNDFNSKVGKQNHCKTCIKEHAAARRAKVAAKKAANIVISAK
jgi:hypothetical protein